MITIPQQPKPPVSTQSPTPSAGGVEGITPGSTIIFYRGTDGLSLGVDPVASGSDILNGCLAGAGLPTSQTGRVRDFTHRCVGCW